MHRHISQSVVHHMKSHFLTLSFLLLLGCQEKAKNTALIELLTYSYPNELIINQIPSSSESLIKEYEKEYQLSICDTTFITAFDIQLGNERSTKIPFSISENCGFYTPQIGSTEVLIKSENEIRVNLEYVQKNQLSDIIYQDLLESFSDVEDVRILFQYEWHNISENYVTELFSNVFWAIERFATTKSELWFEKSLDNLDQKELELFKSKFEVVNSITRVRPDLLDG